MVKRSDVDEMIAAAVQEAVDKVNAEHERKTKAMAAEYEAVIASLKKKEKGGKKDGRWRVWISTFLCDPFDMAAAGAGVMITGSQKCRQYPKTLDLLHVA